MPLLKYQNFTAASRRRNMIAFRMFRAEAGVDINVIEDVGSGLLGITGTQDGANPTFTLSGTPSSTNFLLVRNGLIQHPGAGNDYTLAGNIVTMTPPPATDDILLAIAIGGS